MDHPLREVPADEARHAIAAAILEPPEDPWPLGDVTLRPHQAGAVERLRLVIDRCGGALLADVVGLGKTYVAIALAREALRPVVVGPASLRDMWLDAMRRTSVPMPYVSFERLSRNAPERPAGERAASARRPVAAPHASPDFVIVDEAHHARNPGTRRYRALAALTRSARVLLLTATPVHNRQADLCALLALFLGRQAWTMDEHALGQYLVRRDRRIVPSADHIPDVEPPAWIDVGDDSARLEQLLALPPPLPPADGGDGGALLVYSLVRQWASSQGALRAALERRLARAAALGAALEAGRHPTRDELRAWSFADGAVQLAFPELLPSASVANEELLKALRAHERAARDLLHSLSAGCDADAARARYIRGLLSSHPGEKVVAFSQFADTVGALFPRLRGMPGVAALTADGARIAGGTLTRREALARFAPAASGARPPPPGERIDLLLTTDLLSEGVNLQDASVVIHVDLPWTPARLEQRVGRVARLGSPHRRITVYALAPPAAAETMLGVERRLREKLAVASRAVGVAGSILPPLGRIGAVEPGVTELREEIRRTLRAWSESRSTVPRLHGGERCPSRDTALEAQRAETLVAAVSARESGFIAAAYDERGPHLLAPLGSALTEDMVVVAHALELAAGKEVPIQADSLEEALRAVDRWSLHRRAEHQAALGAAGAARARRAVIDRIAAITARAPSHRRPALAALAHAAREAALVPAGIGAERVLAELAGAAMPDEAWLRAVSTFGSLQPRLEPAGATARPRLVALLLFQPGE